MWSLRGARSGEVPTCQEFFERSRHTCSLSHICTLRGSNSHHLIDKSQDKLHTSSLSTIDGADQGRDGRIFAGANCQTPRCEFEEVCTGPGQTAESGDGRGVEEILRSILEFIQAGFSAGGFAIHDWGLKDAS